MGGFVPIIEQIIEEEGPVAEAEAAEAGEAIAAGADVVGQKIDQGAEAVSVEAEAMGKKAQEEGEAILNKIDQALGQQEVGETTNACEAGEQVAAEAKSGFPEPQVSDPKLKNLVNDLYKGAKTENPIGTGSTADAIREEALTGEPVGGKWHTDKGLQYSRALAKWLAKNPGASESDRAAAQSMLDDLTEALGAIDGSE